MTNTQAIPRITTPHINPNDCWCLVIAQVTGKSYDQIWKDFEGEILPNGSLPRANADYYLLKLGWTPVSLSGDMTVREAIYGAERKLIISSFDTRKRMHHLSYFDGNSLYTTQETDECFEDPALYVYIRIRRTA